MATASGARQHAPAAGRPANIRALQTRRQFSAFGVALQLEHGARCVSTCGYACVGGALARAAF